MSVTPGYFNPPHFWVWTALSHCFLEIHFWEVLVDIFTVVLVGKLIGILLCPVLRIRKFLGLPYSVIICTDLDPNPSIKTQKKTKRKTLISTVL